MRLCLHWLFVLFDPGYSLCIYASVLLLREGCEEPPGLFFVNKGKKIPTNATQVPKMAHLSAERLLGISE